MNSFLGGQARLRGESTPVVTNGNTPAASTEHRLPESPMFACGQGARGVDGAVAKCATLTRTSCRDCRKPRCETHLVDKCREDCDEQHSHAGVCWACFRERQRGRGGSFGSVPNAEWGDIQLKSVDGKPVFDSFSACSNVFARGLEPASP